MPSSARLGAVQRHLANAAAATTELTGRKNEDGSMCAPAAAARRPRRSCRTRASCLTRSCGARCPAACCRAAYDGLTPAQRFEFDVRGYYVMKQYYTPEEVAT
jgi:hypothetical protein